ncbi:MAG: DUF366 family protein [bacterium]|nr:DUF366 family protein [bacterium]
MEGRYITKEIAYTGEELRSHWAFRTFDILGDSMVAFQGPCHVAVDRMVDLADVKADAPIRSERMLHFILEHFGGDLEKAVLRQRLLVSMIGESLTRTGVNRPLVRRGDDLFQGDGKLSVSIAAKTPVSCMIHLGLNVLSQGTPVPTVGLADMGIDPEDLARKVIDQYVEEMEQIGEAQCKVRGVL